MRSISANCAEYSIYRIKMFSAGVWNDQMKGLVTSDNPVEHSSRLDQRHWRLTVCSEVWPGWWSWQTEAYHGDLLTQRWANKAFSRIENLIKPAYAHFPQCFRCVIRCADTVLFRWPPVVTVQRKLLAYRQQEMYKAAKAQKTSPGNSVSRPVSCRRQHQVVQCRLPTIGIQR